ncbi:hypothetical protein BJ684DRAFT_18838 [Piptocephalis cylindrospora]|uniref:Galactose oxidase n=1 Tax=Piptocephalis cylindrospora TaxID=1907219 RepID=A0A4P9Y6P2_9FUNG|nr:hypothetical protein BJ684DRAFT_18838 [Piptocephalis cylindrospora]|eukprot:RKP14776.1 hypothetical protein BJ684DRAFT_18838 [Piptocephalis cylindrospora]
MYSPYLYITYFAWTWTLGSAQDQPVNASLMDVGLVQATAISFNGLPYIVGGLPTGKDPGASVFFGNLMPPPPDNSLTRNFVKGLEYLQAISIPKLTGHAAAPLPQGILLYGGFISTSNSSTLTPHTAGVIHPNDQTFSPLNITLSIENGTSPSSRIEHTLVVSANEALLLGGYDGTGLDGAGLQSVHGDFHAISATNGSSTLLPPPPTGWWQHTATILSSQSLVVLGGVRQDGALESLASANIYNIASKTWRIQPLTGIPPTSRRDHVAIRMDNEFILIHGGTNLDGTALLNDIHVLDTIEWAWSTPSISTFITGRRGHIGLATIYANVLMLGLVQGGETERESFHYLDTQAWSFITSREVRNSKSLSNPAKIAIIVVSATIGVAVLIALGIYWRKVRQRHSRGNQSKKDKSWQWPTEMLSSFELTIHTEHAARPNGATPQAANPSNPSTANLTRPSA